MYEFIRLQYQYFKTITAAQVVMFSPQYITAEQANQIINETNA